MTDETPIAFGAAVSCVDGVGGTLQRVVVDSYEHTITRLVVRLAGDKDLERTVPVELVRAVTADGIEVTCSRAQLESLDAAEATTLGHASTVDLEAQYAELRSMERAGTAHVDLGMGLRPDARIVTEENLGVGEGEVWRGQHVHASDGTLGRLDGLLVDPRTWRLTQLLLAEGHLWGKTEVAIPVSEVKYVFDDGVHLRLTTDEVGALRPVEPQA